MHNSFTSQYVFDQQNWVSNERYERMRNDETYAIDAKSAKKNKVVGINQCDECKENFDGAPFMIRYADPCKLCFCGTTCCSLWMKRHGR